MQPPGKELQTSFTHCGKADMLYYATQLNTTLTPLKELFRGGLYSFTEQKLARATQVHHGTHAQFSR